MLGGNNSNWKRLSERVKQRSGAGAGAGAGKVEEDLRDEQLFWRQKIKSLQGETGTVVGEARAILDQWSRDPADEGAVAVAPRPAVFCESEEKSLVDMLMDRVVVVSVANDPEAHFNPNSTAANNNITSNGDNNMINRSKVSKLKLIQRLRRELADERSKRQISRMQEKRQADLQEQRQAEQEIRIKQEARQNAQISQGLDRLAHLHDTISRSRTRFIYFRAFLAWSASTRMKRLKVQTFAESCRMKELLVALLHWRSRAMQRTINKRHQAQMQQLLQSQANEGLAVQHYKTRLWALGLKAFKLNHRVSLEKRRILGLKRSDGAQILGQVVEQLSVRQMAVKEISREVRNDAATKIKGSLERKKTRPVPFQGMAARLEERRLGHERSIREKEERLRKLEEEREQARIAREKQEEDDRAAEKQRQKEAALALERKREQKEAQLVLDRERILEALRFKHGKLMQRMLERWILHRNRREFRYKQACMVHRNMVLSQRLDRWSTQTDLKCEIQARSFNQSRHILSRTLKQWLQRIQARQRKMDLATCFYHGRMERRAVETWRAGWNQRLERHLPVQAKIQHILDRLSLGERLQTWIQFTRDERRRRWHLERQQEMKRKVLMYLDM